MDRIIVSGVILDADGSPVTGHRIVLQGFDREKWSDLAEIGESEFQVEVPLRRPTPRTEAAGVMPLRLVDLSGAAPTVISTGPMLVPQQESLLADFGHIRLLKEAVRRLGRSVEGELVIGVSELPKNGGGDEYESQLKELRSQLADTRASLAGVQGELELRADQVNAQKVQLSEATSELNLTRQRLATAETNLEDVRTKLSAATSEVQRLTTTLGTPAKVVDVIAGVGGQLSAANEELAKQRTPFRLTEVKLDLRGRLGDGGETIVMDGAGDGSGLSANLAVEVPAPDSPTRGVPDVRGLTEAAATRVLRSVGLRLDAATQRLAKGEGVPGQALAQHPAGGEQAQFGTSVLVIFGVRSQGHD